MFREIDFLSPRFVGPRFSQHGIPLEILKDFAVFQEMIEDAARRLYLKDHLDRQKVPKGFFEGVTMVLKNIGEGSAVAELALRLPLAPEPGFFKSENEEYFEKARDAINDAIDAAEHNESPTAVPAEVLSHFQRFCRFLREDEHIEFRPANPERPARLTRDSRKRLILAAPEVKEYEEEVELIGQVAEGSHEKNIFTIKQRDGSLVTAPKDRMNNDVVTEAYRGFYEGRKVSVRGVGRYNRAGKLLRIETVDQITPIDPLDIEQRLLDLRELRDGWYDGRGVTLDAAGLDWLQESFLFRFDDARLPLPRLFPTVEGNVQAEWSLGSWEVSLEIDLKLKKGFFQAVQVVSGVQKDEEFELEKLEAWQKLGDLLEGISTEVPA